MNKPPSSNSKFKYILPSAVILILLAVPYMIYHSTIYFQISAYTNNKSQVINEWAKEGVDKSTVDRAIDALTYRLMVLRAMVLEDLFCAELCMIIIMLIENIVFRSKYRAIDILEYLALAYLEYSNTLSCIKSYVAHIQLIKYNNFLTCIRLILSFGVLPVLLTALVLSMFIYFTFKKMITRQEQILYGICILEILFAIISHYYYDPLQHMHLGTLLAEHTDVSPQLKNRVLQLAARYGVERNSVFVRENPNVNASSHSGLLFKMVIFNSKTLQSLTEDQLMALLAHELGHIANNDALVDHYVRLVIAVINFVCTIGTYKLISSRCNGLTALVVITYLNHFSGFTFTRLDNCYLGHNMELKADYESFKNSYGNHMIEFLKLPKSLLFDRTKYFNMHFPHPPPLQRIKALRKHLGIN